jgi:hypothetical protein
MFDIEETIRFLYRSLEKDLDTFFEKVTEAVEKHSVDVLDTVVRDVNDAIPESACYWLDHLPDFIEAYSHVEWTSLPEIPEEEDWFDLDIYKEEAYEAIPPMFIEEKCKDLIERFDVPAVIFGRKIYPLPMLWDNEKEQFVTYDQFACIVENRFDDISETEDFEYYYGRPHINSEGEREYPEGGDYTEEFKIDIDIDPCIAALQADIEKDIRKEIIKGDPEKPDKKKQTDGREL